MKDYYKILGIKVTASEDEIRTRWIKLTKKYHPDLSQGNEPHQRIREINEAYQILKFSSTRTEYDLKRAYHGGKKGFSLRRLSFPVSVMILLLIFGPLYFKRSQIFFKPKDPMNGSNQGRQRTERFNDTLNHQLNDIIEKTNRVAPMALKPKEAATQIFQLPTIPPPVEATGLIDQTIQAPIRDPSSVSSKKQISATDLAPQDLRAQPSNESLDWVDPGEQALEPMVISQILPKPPLSTEKEVRQFLANYIDRYIRRDMEGFLSYFSPKAIQNQRDGFEGIRKIYNDFFSQSQSFQYHIEEIKIEIYENAVEVKARYEVKQILREEREKFWKGHIRWVLIKEEGVLKILSLDYQHQKTP